MGGDPRAPKWGTHKRCAKCGGDWHDETDHEPVATVVKLPTPKNANAAPVASPDILSQIQARLATVEAEIERLDELKAEARMLRRLVRASQSKR